MERKKQAKRPYLEKRAFSIGWITERLPAGVCILAPYFWNLVTASGWPMSMPAATPQIE